MLIALEDSDFLLLKKQMEGPEEKFTVGEEREGENHLYPHLLGWMLIWDGIAGFPDGHWADLTLSLLSVSILGCFFLPKGDFISVVSTCH